MIRIDVHGTRGVLYGAIDGNIRNIIQNEMMDYRRFYQGKCFFALISSNLEVLRDQIPDAKWSDEAKKHLDDLDDFRVQASKTREAKLQELPPEALFFDFKIKPYEHQKKAFYLSRDLESFAWLMEMGTGKTKVAIDNCAHLFQKDKINMALIVAPNGVHTQWINEQIPEHMPTWVDYKAFSYASGMGKKKREELDEVLEYDGLRIIAMSFDALSTKKGKDFCQSVLGISKSIFIIDESTRIKNGKAIRTKAICKLGEDSGYRRIMSGAPLTKNIEDLYTQFYFLDPEILGFTSFYAFKNRYCQQIEMVNKQGKRFQSTIGYQNIEELQDKIDGFSFRVTKEECLDLPEKIYIVRPIELTSEQLKLYSELKKYFMAEFSDGSRVTAALAVTRLMRLQRILCGHIENEEKELFRVKSNRAKVCVECVEEAQNKVIVWARFKEDIKILKEEFDKAKIKYIHYFGGNEDLLNEFKNNPEIKVFLANPKSGGIGLNITEANTMIYYSNDFDAETRWQSESRSHRTGQTRNVTIIDLISEGTIDTKIMAALKAKKNLADLVIDGIENILN